MGTEPNSHRSHPRARVKLGAFGLSVLVFSGLFALADDRDAKKAPAVTQDRFTKGDPFPELIEPKAQAQERAALEFVKENDPELAALVERLKGMKPHEYARAIRELFQVSQTLARLKTNDAKRYEVGLDAWKAKSRVEVLSARLASSPSPELESELRAAVEKEFEVNLRRQQAEREFLQERVKKLDETIDRMQKNRDKTVAAKYQYLFRKSMEAGNFDTGTAAPKPRKKGKGTK